MAGVGSSKARARQIAAMNLQISRAALTIISDFKSLDALMIDEIIDVDHQSRSFRKKNQKFSTIEINAPAATPDDWANNL